MKPILYSLAIFASLFFSACEGEPGPPGEPGGIFFSQVFESTVDFQYNAGSNIYTSPVLLFPSSIEVFESDVVLAYILDGQITVGGQPTDVWAQIPLSRFFNDNTGDVFQYSFNNSFVDYQFVIDGNFNLQNLGTDFTDNQTFRIAIVPAEFASANLTMEEVMEMSQNGNPIIIESPSN